MRLTEPHRSRAVAAVGYDEATRTLRVLYRHGGLYDYFEVPPEIYEGLLVDEHPWTRYGLEIKRTYHWQQVSSP